MEDDIAKEIRQDVKELLQRSAVHNELLRTHEARSLALQAGQEKLETRLQPIEEHVSLMNRVAKVLGAVVAGLIVQALVRLLLR